MIYVSSTCDVWSNIMFCRIRSFKLPKIWKDDGKMINVIQDWNLEKVVSTFIQKPLKAVRNSDVPNRLVIVLDAIDECDSKNSSVLQEWLRTVPKTLPSWLHVLVTSRPPTTPFWEHKRALRKDMHIVNMSVDEPGNVDDIDLMVDSKLAQYFEKNSTADITTRIMVKNQLITRAQGLLYNLSFLETVLYSNPQVDANIKSAPVSDILSAQDDVPVNYERSFRRISKRLLDPVSFINIFSPLIVAQEALPQSLLQKCSCELAETRTNVTEFHRFMDIHAAGVLYIVNGNVRMIHPSMSEWLIDYMQTENHVDGALIGHRRLGEACLSEIQNRRYSPYTCRHTILHLCKASRYDEVKRLITTDFAFLLNAVKNNFDIVTELELYFIPFVESLDRATMLVIGVLRLGKPAIEHDFRELASQLIGRVPPQEKESGTLSPLLASAELFLIGNRKGWLPVFPTLELADIPLIRVLEEHDDVVTAVCVSPDNEIIATGCADKYVRLYTSIDGALLHVFDKHNWPVNDVAFSKSGKFLSSVSTGGELILWNLRIPEQSKVLEDQHEGPILCVAFTPKRMDRKTYLATGGADGFIKIWNMRTSSSKKKVFANGNPSRAGVTCVAFNHDGTHVVAGLETGDVRIWNFENESASVREILHPHGDVVTSIAFSTNLNDAKTFLSSSLDGFVHLWNIESEQKLKTFNSSNPILDACFSYNGNQILTAVGDVIEVWSNRAAERHWSRTRIVKGHSDEVQSIDVLKNKFLSASADGTVRIWQIANEDVAADASPLPEPLTETQEGYHSDESDASDDDEAFFLNTSLLNKGLAKKAKAVPDKSTQDQGKGNNINRIIVEHKDWIVNVAVSPDGRYAATASKDGTVGLWNVKTGMHVRFLPANSVSIIHFSPDGKFLAASGTKLMIWNVQTGELDTEVAGHSQKADSLVFSEDGQLIKSIDVLGNLVVWSRENRKILDESTLTESLIESIEWKMQKDLPLNVRAAHVGPPEIPEYENKDFVGFTLDSHVNIKTVLAPSGLEAIVCQGSKIHFLYMQS
uniref:Nephrocystin 3-like N-terminal domain-containing protein n=1 Tax=Aplanochytrium stocchinoi TaxID=215587 RepID=A0A7S3PGX0_9STRA